MLTLIKTDLAAGTMVRVRTSNGGDITAPLAQRYRPTYPAYLNINGRPTYIPAERITSVEPAATP